MQMVIVVLFLVYLGAGLLSSGGGFGEVTNHLRKTKSKTAAQIGYLARKTRLDKKKETGYNIFSLSNFKKINESLNPKKHNKNEKKLDWATYMKRKLKGAVSEHIIGEYVKRQFGSIGKKYDVEEINTQEQLDKYFDQEGEYKAFITGKDSNDTTILLKSRQNEDKKTEFDRLIVLKDKNNNQSYIINVEIKSGEGYEKGFYDRKDPEKIDLKKIEKIKRTKYDLVSKALKSDAGLIPKLIYVVPEGLRDSKIEYALRDAGIEDASIIEAPIREYQINSLINNMVKKLKMAKNYLTTKPKYPLYKSVLHNKSASYNN